MAISDVAFYIVDGVYNDEFDDAGEAMDDGAEERMFSREGAKPRRKAG